MTFIELPPRYVQKHPTLYEIPYLHKYLLSYYNVLIRIKTHHCITAFYRSHAKRGVFVEDWMSQICICYLFLSLNFILNSFISYFGNEFCEDLLKRLLHRCVTYRVKHKTYIDLNYPLRVRQL